MAKESSDEEEKKKKAAEEAARKAKIRAQIATKQTQVTSLRGYKETLNEEKTDINDSIQKWEDAKTAFNAVNIANLVVVDDVFEGKAATSIKEENAKKMDKMKTKISSANTVKTGISTQISKIESKISTLNSQISSLKSQL